MDECHEIAEGIWRARYSLERNGLNGVAPIRTYADAGWITLVGENLTLVTGSRGLQCAPEAAVVPARSRRQVLARTLDISCVLRDGSPLSQANMWARRPDQGARLLDAGRH